MATEIIIYMYTGENCSKCKRAKEMFAKLPNHIEIKLIERNVDKNKDYMERLVEYLESNTLPTFEIHDGYGSKPLIYRGFDENIGKIMDVLGL